jgi:phosphate uptake regulator
MVHLGLAAYEDFSLALAHRVYRTLTEVAELSRTLTGRLASVMKADASVVEASLNLLGAVQCLQRIADHMGRIAKEVMFLIEASRNCSNDQSLVVRESTPANDDSR